MIPQEVNVERDGSRVRFEIEGVSTDWMDESDRFTERIDESNLNRAFLSRHILKEIEIRNILDEGMGFLEGEEYAKAIGCFDDVLFYDDGYGEALIGKSRALFCQKHFVKSLRYYRRAVDVSSDFEDEKYNKTLLEMSDKEIDAFPKLKRNIYAADEYFSEGEYQKALKNYKKTLLIPSIGKEKILFKLYNKIATTHLKLNEFEDALMYFNASAKALNNDYAYYGKGLCEYEFQLDVAAESLKRAVKLEKGQLLEKGLILNELECYRDALETFDFLLENHFTVDKMYITALNGKMYAMRKLEMDLSEMEKVMDELAE